MWCLRVELVLVLVFAFTSANGFYVIDCSKKNVNYNLTNAPLELTRTGNIATYNLQHVSKLLLATNEPMTKKYLDAKLAPPKANELNLIIYTTSEFAKYAKEQRATVIRMQLLFDCGRFGNRTMQFNQPILEHNYYQPLFRQHSFDLLLPTPAFSGFELTSLYDISAQDNDLINNQLTFKAANGTKKFINVGTKNETRAMGRIHFASVRLERIFMDLIDPIEFDMEVTDAGIPPLKSIARIKIRADKGKRFPIVPHFERDFYNLTINRDYIVKPFQINLLRHTYSEAVKFYINGTDKALFSIKAAKNAVKVSLKVPLDMNLIRYRSFLQFNLIAEHTHLKGMGVGLAKTVVFMALPNLKANFNFEKNIYEGQISADGSLILEDIKFNILGFNQKIQFALDGSQASSFNLTQKIRTLRVKFSDNYLLENWANETHITLRVVATLEYLNATSCIIIELAKWKAALDTPVVQPEFVKPLYQGTINVEGVLQLEPITFEPKTFVANKTIVSLSGNMQEYFDFLFMDNGIKLELLKTPAVNARETSLHLVMTANNGALKSNAIIAIDIQGKENYSCGYESIFNQPWVVGKILGLNATQELRLNPIALKTDKNPSIEDFLFVLQGEESKNFDITVNKEANSIVVNLVNAIDSNTLENKTQIVLQIAALNQKNPTAKDFLIVFLHLPWRDCLHQMTTLVPNKPIFSSKEYLLTVTPNQVGSIGLLSATMPDNNGTISYSLYVEHATLKRQISINAQTGELLLLSYVAPGVYYFSVTAMETVSLARASVRVRLNVDAVFKCVKKQQPEVAHALIVKYIEEERAHNELLNVSIDESCHLAIVNMQPNDKAYVYVVPETHMLASIAIDRESATFRNMTVPQINIELRLQCNGKNNRQHTMAHNEAFVQDIPYSPDTTMLRLFIVDVNDNAPQFVYPVKSLDVGYPAPELRFLLFPEYLIQVVAVDADAGEFSAIHYALSENSDFEIEPKLGIIYPKAQALETNVYVELSVQAIDAGGLITELQLRVHRLNNGFYALLTAETDNLEAAVQELVALSGMEITLVRQARLPPASSPTNATHFLSQAWIYAFSASLPVYVGELQSQIERAASINLLPLSATSYDQALAEYGPKNDKFGYIIAVSFLSVLSITCLTFLVYSYDCSHKSSQSNDIDHCAVYKPSTSRPRLTSTANTGTPSENSRSTLGISQANSANIVQQHRSSGQNCECESCLRIKAVVVEPMPS